MKPVAVLAAVVGTAFLPVSVFEAAGASGRTVTESAREIPLAYDVDVVVVGGSTGAVAAAAEAARSGAKVFLAAPRPYLGEDVCGTLRLWLREGDTPTSPLAKKLFGAKGAHDASFRHDGRRLPFRYEAHIPSSGGHRDTRPPSLLSDGRWGTAVSESVEYSGDVDITIDLHERHRLKSVHVLVFHTKDFLVGSAAVYSSESKRNWKAIATVRNENRDQGSVDVPALPLSAQVSEETRYLRVSVRRAPGAARVLLGEIVVVAAGGAPADAAGPDRAPPPPPPSPLHVKRTLDEELLEAGARFLFGCYATDCLRDARGEVAGIVMANRSGRQAVRAKVVIDATDRAWVARMAGARFGPYPAGPQQFKRVVVGGEALGVGGLRSGRGMTARRLDVAFTSRGRRYPVIEYTLTIPMKDGSFASFAEAEQIARDMTFHPAQVDASEVLFQVPPDRVKGEASPSGDWPGAGKVPLGAFRPAGVRRLYVLGGCSDLPREAAEELLRPLELMETGARLGRTAAAEARRLPPPRGVRLGRPELAAGRLGGARARARAATTGDVREILVGVRPVHEGLPTVPADERAVRVLGTYDVVVVGGGTGGAPAGIGAARRGAKTLVVEYLHGLGGVGTLGLIGKYYHGYRGGFTAEADKGIKAIGGANYVIAKMEYWRRENRKSGAEIWFGTLGCGAFVERGRVKGVVVATPEGRGVVLAKAVVDSTGNADVAAAAGAECAYTDGSHVGVQGTGLPPRELGLRYTNTDYTFSDDTDVVDTWHLFVYAKRKFARAYDLGQLVDTRERRRIVGEFVLTPLDMINGRTYPDTVVMSMSNFDSHGFTVHPVFMLKPPDRKSMTVYTPYRCLLPRGLDGILVTGLGASVHRDAVPVVRMQPDIQNQGYAAGTAAAMAAGTGRGSRRIDIKALQKHLVQIGSLRRNVLTDTDSFPCPTHRIAAAVKSVVNNYDGIALVLAQPEQALPLLREAYASAASEEHRLVYAHILGVMGDAAGAGTLIAKVGSAARFDRGWNFTGMGQFGMSLSPLDSYIVALGRTRDSLAVRPILEKVKMLDAGKEFSHHRAVAMALEALRDPAAAPALYELLSKPGMTGHSVTSMDHVGREAAGGGTATKPRNDSLRELVLARALYRSGDYRGLGEKILRQYERDLRGHYARHAHAILKEK